MYEQDIFHILCGVARDRRCPKLPTPANDSQGGKDQELYFPTKPGFNLKMHAPSTTTKNIG